MTLHSVALASTALAPAPINHLDTRVCFPTSGACGCKAIALSDEMRREPARAAAERSGGRRHAHEAAPCPGAAQVASNASPPSRCHVAPWRRRSMSWGWTTSQWCAATAVQPFPALCCVHAAAAQDLECTSAWPPRERTRRWGCRRSRRRRRCIPLPLLLVRRWFCSPLCRTWTSTRPRACWRRASSTATWCCTPSAARRWSSGTRSRCVRRRRRMLPPRRRRCCCIA